MDKITKQAINKMLLIPMIVTLVATLLMISCLFLPYATAVGDYAEALNQYPDDVISAEMNLTAKDMKDISMVEYASMYVTLEDQLFGGTGAGVFYAVLVGLIGGFALIAMLFALGRKPIAVMVFTALAYGVFTMQNWDYTDRGVIPSSSYDWGLAHTIFPIVAFIALAGSTWMLVTKVIAKKQVQSETLNQSEA